MLWRSIACGRFEVFLPVGRVLFLVFLFVVFGVGSWLFGLRPWLFGLSLNSYWFISVAPVRGRHLLFFACRKEK
jgi:hypothetical protein